MICTAQPSRPPRPPPPSTELLWGCLILSPVPEQLPEGSVESLRAESTVQLEMAPFKVIRRLQRRGVASKVIERVVIGDVVEMWITSERR